GGGGGGVGGGGRVGGGERGSHSTARRASRVMRSLERSMAALPAARGEVCEARACRSTRATRRSPRRMRKYAVAAPSPPDPITTTSASRIIRSSCPASGWTRAASSPLDRLAIPREPQDRGQDVPVTPGSRLPRGVRVHDTALELLERDGERAEDGIPAVLERLERPGGLAGPRPLAHELSPDPVSRDVTT